MSLDPTNRLFDLTGKVAVVTGAARGIGEGIGLRLADAGAKVVLTDVSSGGIEDVAGRIAAGGGSAVAVAADLTKDADREKIVATAVERFGALDILVNNAGLRDWYTWETLTPEVWDRFMAVNTKAVFFLSQAAARQMIAQGRGGAMVNIASTAAAVPVPWKVDYNVAKAGVVNLSRSLAKELGRHMIRVNAIGPGGTRTPGGSGAIPDHISPDMLKKYGEEYMARTALPVGLLDPDDIARAVLFFVTDAARYVTGQTLYVDAGYTAG